jgi:hypothetical protein
MFSPSRGALPLLCALLEAAVVVVLVLRCS